MDKLYSFTLPDELIAQMPANPRDHARLLVYDRRDRVIVDDYFYNLASYLPQGTLVVANNTKVNHCRYLFDDARTEIFAVEAVNDRTVRAMVRPGKRFKLGSVVALGEGLECAVTAIDDEGLRTLVFNTNTDDRRLLGASHVPLPPYITQNDSLADEYQTIYAKKPGSLAAPTAGLHFTNELKSKITQQFGWAELNLEVGLGTFAPLSDNNFTKGTLHSEKYSIEPGELKPIVAAKHITAVGTTSLRALESLYSNKSFLSKVEPRKIGKDGITDIFIQPGFEFCRVNSLITNFHLPSTSLLLLVEAFLGSRSELKRIYQHAIKEKYRFYSFGDAMLII